MYNKNNYSIPMDVICIYKTLESHKPWIYANLWWYSDTFYLKLEHNDLKQKKYFTYGKKV